MRLTREQIGDFQDQARSAELVFPVQVTLEGDDEAWTAVTRIAEDGGYGQEQRGPDQALTVLGRMI